MLFRSMTFIYNEDLPSTTSVIGVVVDRSSLYINVMGIAGCVTRPVVGIGAHMCVSE